MASIKASSYSNVILTAILAVMGWNVRLTSQLSGHIEGIDKEVIFNKIAHSEFKDKQKCFQVLLDKNEDAVSLNEKNILRNKLSIVAIKHELELEVVEDEN